MKKPLLFGIILTACVIIVTFVFSLGYPGGMISYWKFEEGSELTASDSVDANDGTLVNGAGWASGQVGGALSFDGVDDYVEIPHSTSLDITDQIAVSAWINLDSVNQTVPLGGTIIRKGAWPVVVPPPAWGFDIMYGKLRAFIYDGGSPYIANGDTVLSAGVWYHVAFTYDGSEVQIYLNGELEGDPASHTMGHIDSTPAPVWIGRKNHLAFFDGIIDEVAIYSRALTADEIQLHYLDGLNGSGYEVECIPPPAGLVSWWDGDDVSGTDAFDIQDGNDGTLVNGATTVPGKVGDAFSFDGINDYIEVSNVPSLTMGTGDLTVAAWVKILDNTHNNRFVDTGARQNEGYSIFYYSPMSHGGSGPGVFIVQWHTSGFPKDTGPNRQSVGGMDIGDGNWHHVAGVWDRDTAVKAYVDGMLVGSAPPKFLSSEHIANARNLRIGSEAAAVRQLTNGLIDEVQIFNRALTGEEILYEFLAGSAGKCKVEPNQPPVALCQDIEISVDENCQASIAAADVDNGSYDPDEGDTITFSIDNTGPFSPGIHDVNLTVTDENAASTTCQASVTVNDTSPPVPDITPLPTLTGECSVTITSTPTATDNCAESITGTTSDPRSYSVQGTYTVTWTYDDGNGNLTTQEQTINVNDVTAPIPNVTELAEVTGECSVEIPSTPTPTATDNCAGTVSGTTNDPLIYTEQGTFTVTWTYNDGNGNLTTQEQTVKVEDTTSPIIDNFTVEPNVLRPPNHKMILITPTIIASDNCDPDPVFVLTSITMNEGEETNTFDPTYDSILGDGHTLNDIQVDENGDIYLRAERSGKGTGRIYTIFYKVIDASGNSSATAEATVTVPHDQK